MTDARIYAGTLLATADDRTFQALLVPFNEECSSNLGRFKVGTGAFSIPADMRGQTFNVDHTREIVAGEVTTMQETSRGIMGTVYFAKTPEGDSALADVHAGRRRAISAEVAEVVIKAGRAISGRLFGASLVKAGAFPSATLLAEAVDTDEEPPAGTEPVTTTEKFSDEYTDEDGVTHKRTTTRTTTVDGDTTTIKETTVIEEPDTPNPEEEAPVGAATVPNTLTATKARPVARDAGPGLAAVYAAMAAVKSGQFNAESSTLLATLTDVKFSGTGALPAAGVLQPNWVGPVWQGKTYERQFITLGQLGTDITAGGKKGYKLNRGTAAVPKTILGGDWTGNKTEVPTGGAFTDVVSSTLRRFAFAADIAREFTDLPGGSEVIEAFIRLIVEDYAVWSDEKALADIVTLAGTPVAPSTYPTQYSGAIGQVIQGILAVKRSRDIPTFALVNATAYEQLVYTPKDLIPEFISLTVSTDGEGTADGVVKVVQAPDSFFTGIKANKPATIVGARNAIEFDENGSTPIHVDALEIAKGGVDRAVHGYLQTFNVRPEAVVLVGEAAAAA